MNKLSIESLIIEKSHKDIQTGIIHNFTDEINLVYGGNEAGKSSLLSFIRQGFFKIKGVDKGKIYFKLNDGISEKHYRTDIQDNNKTDLRCRVFDENNNPISYDFIENIINKKYFEQGFTINLDDLMNIQNKDNNVLINAIKDPSGEKLNLLLDKIRLETKKILGDNNRLTKDTSSILDNINIQNSKINELSNLEAQYNLAVDEIKSINEELETIYKKEEFLGILKNIKDLENKLFTLQEQRSIKITEFSEKLFNNQEKYTVVIQNKGKLEANIAVLNKNYPKIEQLNTKISIDLNRLQNEFLLNPKTDEIQNFKIDYNILKRLKEINSKKFELEKELLIAKQNKENIDENLLKLKNEINSISNENIDNLEIEKLEKLYKFLDENLAKYNYFQAKLNEIEKLNKIKFPPKNIFILFTALFMMTIAIAFLCFYNKVPQAGIFAVITSILLILCAYFIKISSYTNSQITERKNLEELKNAVYIQLKEQINDENVESFYLPIKIENMKTEIKNKIENYKRLNDIIKKNLLDILYNKEKLVIADNKIKQIQNDIDKSIEEAQNNVRSINNEIDISLNDYVETVEIIKSLKNNIDEINSLTKDTKEIENENNQIIQEFNDFVNELNLKLSFTDNYSENIQLLKAYNEKNTSLKNNMDIIEAQIESINKQIKNLKDKKHEFIGIDEKYISEEELADLKQEKLKNKKDAEYKKRDLESFEGLNELKIKKEVFLNEYRKKIYTLVKNKMILQIVKTAKERFDKIHPDLKEAQKYLEILTNGKYSRINLDLEEIQNEDKSLIKKWNELSRGTKEQLYLALKLGYASNYTKDKITMSENGKPNLPLIIDDAFVNFDENRTRQGIKCLIEFAKTNQVILFTCHNEIMQKYFEELCNNSNTKLNVINIG